MTETDYMKLHERILAHTGLQYLQALQAYSTSKNILSGNAFQLRKVIEVVEDPTQAADLWAVRNRKRLKDLQSETIRHFHNFLASVKTLVDHTRVMMGEPHIAQAHREEYREKAMQVFGADPLSRFIQDFRNYTLHRGIPITGFEFSWSQGEDVASKVYLDLSQMENWEGWKPLSRDFISNHKPKLAMVTLLDQYELKAKKFHEWFCTQFQKHYEREIDEVLDLQRQWNEGLEEKSRPSAPTQ
jgi:hypothetical protein